MMIASLKKTVRPCTVALLALCTAECQLMPILKDPLYCWAEKDSDGDGHIDANCGGDDCNDNDPTRWTKTLWDCDAERPPGTADWDCDGHFDVNCGGDDCDDGWASAYVGGESFCGDLLNPYPRDGNCDGVADNLYECTCRRANAKVDLDCDAEPMLHGYEVVAWKDTGPSRDVSVYLVDTSYDFTHSIAVASEDGIFLVEGTKPSACPGTRCEERDVRRNWKVTDVVENITGRRIAAYANNLFVVDDVGFRSLVLEKRRLFVSSTVRVLNDARSVFVFMNRAYVTSALGLHVFDASDPSTLREVSALGMSDLMIQDAMAYPTDLFVADGMIYIAVWGSAFPPHYDFGQFGMYVVEASDRELPARVYDPVVGDAWADGVFVMDDRVYLAIEDGLRIYDIETTGDPVQPVELGEPRRLDGLGVIHDVFVTGGFAYLAGDDGLYLVNVRSDPLSVLSGPVRLPPPGAGDGAASSVARAVHVVHSWHSVEQVGEEWYAFVATDDGLYIVDLMPRELQAVGR
jgi:hypothetical protein